MSKITRDTTISPEDVDKALAIHAMLTKARQSVSEVADAICEEFWGKPTGERHREAADAERIIRKWLEAL